MARHWAEVGFGTPIALHLFYVVKIPAYILGARLIAVITTGLEGRGRKFSAVTSRYAEPIVYQKAVLDTMLLERSPASAAASVRRTIRFFPPMGSILYWLRPKTITAATMAEPGAF